MNTSTRSTLSSSSSSLSRSRSSHRERPKASLPYPGRVFLVTQTDAHPQTIDDLIDMKNRLIERLECDKAAIREIKIDSKPHLRKQIYESFCPDNERPLSDLQTPLCFFGSEFIGTNDDMNPLPDATLKEKLKHALANDPGPLAQIYKDQDNLVQFFPPTLYFPPPYERKITCRAILKNLSSELVIFKMRTNNRSAYNVSPKQAFIPANGETVVEFSLRADSTPTSDDKFQFEGGTIQFADETYIPQIDVVLNKLRTDKKSNSHYAKQKLICRLNNPPSETTNVIEKEDNEIIIEWKEPQQESTKVVEQPEEQEEEETTTPATTESTTQHQGGAATDISPPPSTTTNVQENTSQDDESPESSENASIQEKKGGEELEEKPTTKTSPKSTTKPSQKSTSISSNTPTNHNQPSEKPSEKPSDQSFNDKPSNVESRVEQSETEAQEENIMDELSSQIKQDAKKREEEAKKQDLQEVSLQKRQYDQLKLKYDELIEKFDASTKKSNQLKSENQHLESRIVQFKQRIEELEKKLQTKEELRKRSSSAVDSRDTKKSSVETPAVIEEHGYPLIILVIVAVIAFLVGNMFTK